MQRAPREDIDAAVRGLQQAIITFDPLRFRMWSQMGLTTAQLRVLFYIREKPGVTAGELASQLTVTPPTVSGIVERLVRMNLARREEDPSDRRLVRNNLTDEGEAACSRLEQGTEVYTRRILVELTPEELSAMTKGLSAFVHASQMVRREVPDLAAMAMP